MPIDPHLLARLACPQCREPLSENPDSSALRCAVCNKHYPVSNGIPILKPNTHTLRSTETTYSQKYQPVNKHSTFARVLHNSADRITRLQKPLIPVTPLSPLYQLRKYKGYFNRLPDPKVILDAGGGTSPYRQFVSSEKDEFFVLDVENSIIGEADGRYVVIGDLHTIPFRENQFDLILLIEVAEHLYNPIQAISQLASCLKPGGLIFLTTPQYWHIHGWPSDYYRYTKYGLKYLCENSGLQILEISPKGGPFLLLYAVLKLNFMKFLSLPIIRVLLDVPFVLIFWGLDTIFFRDNLRTKNPDSVGWGLIAEKGGSSG